MKKGPQYRNNLINDQISTVKQYAVILRGDVIEKIYDYPDQYELLNSDPNVIVFEDCDLLRLDEKAEYWDRIVHYDPIKMKKEEEEFLKRISKK